MARVETPEVERLHLGVRVAEVMRVTAPCYLRHAEESTGKVAATSPACR